MPPRRGFIPRPSDGRGCRRQVRDLVFWVVVLQRCRAYGAGGKIPTGFNHSALRCEERSTPGNDHIKIKPQRGFIKRMAEMIQLFQS